MTWTGAPAGDVPLVELDRLLGPVRRVLSWAVADSHRQIRYAEVNLGRFLRPASALDVPEVARAALGDIVRRLDGFDAAPPDDHRARIGDMYATLARVDAVLGLPLGRRVSRPASPALTGSAEVIEVWSGDEPGEPEAVVPDVAVDDSERRTRFGDPSATGRALTAFGLSAETLAALAEEGVETLLDLLLTPPSDDEVLRPIHGAGREVTPGRIAIGGRVRQRVTRLTAGGARTEVVLVGAGPIRAVFSGVAPAWMLDRLAVGERCVLVGSWDGACLQSAEPAVARGHEVVLARYGFEGVPDEVVRGVLWRAQADMERVKDILPREVVDRVGVVSLSEALVGAHLGGLPATARRRLAFDEALLVQLGLAAPRFTGVRERGIAHAVQHGLVARLCSALGVVLDDSRQSAFEDIKRDLRGPLPMTRLLTGEAGAGKGLLALLAAVIVAEAKVQVLFLSNDPMSAEMRGLFGEALLREVGLVGRIVVGEPTRAQRDAIRRGEVHVVFATPDLLDREVEFRRLGLVVAVEGGDNGSYGRVTARLSAFRPPRPDLLVLATTPVPSAVLLSAYGDHDLSVVDGPDDPALRAVSPLAEVFSGSSRDEAWRRVARSVASGAQAMVLLPTVVGADGAPAEVVDLREARRIAEAIETELFGARDSEETSPRVSVLHGSLAREERLRVYDDLRHRRITVLVSTIPAEEGPPIPGLEVIVVESADQASEVRLQRIRGYLAASLREGAASVDPLRAADARVLLVVGEAEPARRAQLEAFAAGTVGATPTSGWDLAEQGLRKRGLEGLLAREVPAAARLRWLDPGEDREILLRAREEAHRILDEDPALRRPIWQDLSRLMRERWDDLVGAPAAAGEPADRAAAAGKRRRRRRKRR